MEKLFYSGPKRSELHNNYAKCGRIDEQAAVQDASSINIGASAEAVWSLLADMPSWPRFNPLISDVRLESEVREDATGSLKIGGFPVKIQFAVVEPNKELSWTGTLLWMKAIDRLVLEPTSPDSCRLFLEESLAGAFVPLMTNNDRLQQQHKASLESFKKAALKR